MGGISSQLGFYYQNLFCILQILERRRDGIIRAMVDQKLEDLDIQENGEIDLVLEYQDSSREYYEVKSGSHFTKDDNKIRKSVLALFAIHKNTNNTDMRNHYFLVINRDLGAAMAERIMQIKRIRGPDFRQYMNELGTAWQIDESDYSLFRSFCQSMNLDPGYGLTNLRQLCLSKIEAIEDCVGEKVFNMHYKHRKHKHRTILKDDLLNRLIILLLDCLDSTSGNIGLEHESLAVPTLFAQISSSELVIHMA